MLIFSIHSTAAGLPGLAGHKSGSMDTFVDTILYPFVSGMKIMAESIPMLLIMMMMA